MTSAYRAKGKGEQVRASREAGEGRPFNPATIKAMIDGPMPEKRPEGIQMTTIRTTWRRWLSRGVAGARSQVELWEPDYAAAGSPAARGLDL